MMLFSFKNDFQKNDQGSGLYAFLIIPCLLLIFMISIFINFVSNRLDDQKRLLHTINLKELEKNQMIEKTKLLKNYHMQKEKKTKAYEIFTQSRLQKAVQLASMEKSIAHWQKLEKIPKIQWHVRSIEVYSKTPLLHKVSFSIQYQMRSPDSALQFMAYLKHSLPGLFHFYEIDIQKQVRNVPVLKRGNFHEIQIKASWIYTALK